MHPFRRKRTKANYAARAGETIAGNLTRGATGQFARGGGGTTAPAVPTDRQARTAQRAQDRARAGKTEADLRAKEDAALAAAKPGKARTMVRMQIASARRERATIARQARADQAVADATAPTAARPKKEETPKKGGGGGGGKNATPDPKDAAAQRKKETRNAIKQHMADRDIGLAPRDFDALTSFADGESLDPQAAQSFGRMGLVEGSPPRLSIHGRTAMAAIDRGNIRAAVDAIGTGTQRTNATPDPKDGTGSKSFAVFKNSDQQDRWLAITTTAYQDQEGEYISRQAIVGAVAHGDRTGQRGTLRYWHVPHVELGDCDFQAATAENRLLIESGTFRSKAAAEIGSRMAAAGWQMSPGFLHPPTEPAHHTYRAMLLFERSLCPPGQASNPYTAFVTKEIRPTMHDDKMKALQALTADNPALLAALLAQATNADQTAQDAGASYKDAPIWAQALAARMDALEATKAAPPMDMAAAVADDLAMEPQDDPAESVDDGPLLGEADLAAIAQAVLAALAPTLDLEKKMRGHLDEMKGMVGGGMAAKDATIAALDQRLAALEGDSPAAAGYRASTDPSTALPANVAAQFKATPHLTTPNGASPDPVAVFLSHFLGGTHS